MKVLVATEDPSSGRTLARLLSQVGYTVEVVSNGEAALDRLSDGRFALFLYDSTMSNGNGPDTIQKVRACVRNQPVALLLGPAGGREAKELAEQGGADDYVSKPYGPPELLEAIARALSRRSTSTKPPRKASSSRPPRSLSAAARAAPAIETTVAWAELIKSVGVVLTRFTGIPFAYEQPVDRESALDISAAAFMVDVTHLVEVACGLFVTQADGTEIAQRIHPTKVNAAAVRELLTELGNNVLGNLKVTLLRQGFRCTIGLGQPTGTPSFTAFQRCFSVCSVSGFTGGGAHIGVVVGARPALRVAVPVRKLREDMVLAADLTEPGGTTLLPAGTRLTASTIERIALHPPRGMVHVCTPASRW
jgi:DNA-binding response OmpR family regulator